MLLQLQGDVWFSLSPTVLKKHNECDTLTPKSLKILSDSWLPNSLGSYCSWLPAVCSTTATEKFICVGMSNYSFFCCNSSLHLKVCSCYQPWTLHCPDQDWSKVLHCILLSEKLQTLTKNSFSTEKAEFDVTFFSICFKNTISEMMFWGYRRA